MESVIKDVLTYFPVMPEGVQEFDSGLINKSYRIEGADGRIYVLQRINKEVFGDIDGMMENIQIAHAALQSMKGYTVPVFVPSSNGQSFLTDPDGFSWRLMSFIPNSVTIDHTEDPNTAFHAGKIIGKFHRGTIPCEIDRMNVTFPDFHDLSFRSRQFSHSLEQSDVKENALTEIDEIKRLINYFESELPDELPLRVTHNDTKLNNILFESRTRKALCLIDLDTVMPGHVFHDFGDAIRTLCNTREENDPNPDEADFNFELFEAFSKGYTSEAHAFLTNEEWQTLPLSIEYMPFIMGLRFLTDYLSGNTYYKVDYAEQNLIRCRNQLRLISRMENSRIRDYLEAVRKGLS